MWHYTGYHDAVVNITRVNTFNRYLKSFTLSLLML